MFLGWYSFLIFATVTMLPVRSFVIQKPYDEGERLPTKARSRTFRESTRKPLADREASYRSALTKEVQKNYAPLKENSTFVPKLLEEVGDSNPVKMYKEVYDDNSKTKICWYENTYVKEYKNGHRSGWKEHEIIFDFPEDNGQRKNDVSVPYKNEIVQYKIAQDTNSNTSALMDFKTFEKNENFTIRKHEKVSCGAGNFLVKTYFEWPKSNRKKLVVMLGDSKQNSYKKDEINNEEQTGRGDGINRGYNEETGSEEQIVLGSQMKYGNQNNLKAEANKRNEMRRNGGVENKQFRQNQASSDDTIGMNTHNGESDFLGFESKDKNAEDINGSEKVRTAQDDSNESAEPQLDFIDPVLASQKFESDADFNISPFEDDDIFVRTEGKSSEDSVLGAFRGYESKYNSTLDSCSPVLTQLLSGNGVFTGLCNLKKDDTIVLKGDIVVSKKYFNANNNSEVVKPLYLIHEDTEIDILGTKLE